MGMRKRKKNTHVHIEMRKQMTTEEIVSGIDNGRK